MSKFDWNDITIVPDTLSTIASRSEINPLQNGKLPLFTAPMDMVIDENNISIFEDNNINICLPRNVKYDKLRNDNYFYSYGLDEIIELFISGKDFPKKVLIDVANGHMFKLWDISKRIKEKFGNNIELMVGNIANPETYRKYCEIGVDWIRVGIGGGCFTPDSLVMTDNGYKSIKDINIGDKVITHKNRLREVIQTHTFDKKEKLIKVNGIECTKNHEFYVILKSDREFINDENIDKYALWIESSKLNKDLHLLIKF
jgi:hypothetical protein